MKQTVIRKMIDQLQKEMVEIQYAIQALEALAAGKPRRGRPPKFLGDRPAAAPKRRKPRSEPVR